MTTASTVSRFPLALLADGEVFAIVGNAAQLEAASDSAAYPGVKLTTRPATREEIGETGERYEDGIERAVGHAHAMMAYDRVGDA